jgi:hypothetical protein
MAKRPLFIPKVDSVGVDENLIDFKWFSGFAASQKKKSIESMHSAAIDYGFKNLLEISSKSEDSLGVALSAFNLLITTKKHNRTFSVECAFQSSKVFNNGGPYLDLLEGDSLSAKKDIRLKSSGNVVCFRFFNQDFPIEPRTFFYDWIYINALLQNENLANNILSFDAFTDIEFNPEKSINCQAHSVALYISLINNNVLNEAMSSPDKFLIYTEEHYKKQLRKIAVQQKMI